MVKENNLKLVSPTVVKEIPKKAGGGRSTALSSIVISVVVILAISLIGLGFAYMGSNHSYLDSVKGCTGMIHGFEQKGYYTNMEQFKSALGSCSG
jgi:hypothetical protein